MLARPLLIARCPMHGAAPQPETRMVFAVQPITPAMQAQKRVLRHFFSDPVLPRNPQSHQEHYAVVLLNEAGEISKDRCTLTSLYDRIVTVGYKIFE